MIISVKFGRNRYLAKHTKCFLNDVEISSDCYSACDKHGVALCYVRGEDGRHVRDPERPSRVLREVRRGNVRFEFKPMIKAAALSL